MSLDNDLNDLEQLLQEESDFNEIYKKFFSVVQNDDFISSGAPCSDNRIEEMLKRILLKIFDSTKLINIMIINIEKYGFYHGTVSVDALPGSFFYFKDISMGMLAVVKRRNDEISFIRFTGENISKGNFIVTTPSTATH